ncbi:energy-coupling factor transporter transmembrane protein EcfT, partial [Methanoculleus bourgensis]
MPEIMQYVTRESAFHRLHPLTKLIFAVVVVALAVLTSDTVMLAALVGAVLAAAAIAGLARDLLRQVPLLLMLAASLLILTVLTIQSGETLGYL